MPKQWQTIERKHSKCSTESSSQDCEFKSNRNKSRPTKIRSARYINRIVNDIRVPLHHKSQGPTGNPPNESQKSHPFPMETDRSGKLFYRIRCISIHTSETFS